MEGQRRVLTGLSDIRAFFHTNNTPLYFVSPTPFNLLGIDRWVRNFFCLNYFDSYKGDHPRVFVPRRMRMFADTLRAFDAVARELAGTVT